MLFMNNVHKIEEKSRPFKARRTPTRYLRQISLTRHKAFQARSHIWYLLFVDNLQAPTRYRRHTDITPNGENARFLLFLGIKAHNSVGQDRDHRTLLTPVLPSLLQTVQTGSSCPSVPDLLPGGIAPKTQADLSYATRSSTHQTKTHEFPPRPRANLAYPLQTHGSSR